MDKAKLSDMQEARTEPPTNSISSSSTEMNFDDNSGIMTPHFCAKTKRHKPPAILLKCLTIILFGSTESPSRVFLFLFHVF